MKWQLNKNYVAVKVDSKEIAGITYEIKREFRRYAYDDWREVIKGEEIKVWECYDLELIYENFMLELQDEDEDYVEQLRGEE